MGTLSGIPRPNSAPLDAFVPALIRRRLGDASAVVEPSAESFPAAVLLADLSGFSPLSEKFAQHGPRGAEDLNDVVNFFCGHLVDIVDAHGGEIVKFAGDAALAIWPVRDADDASVAQAAAQCAVAALRMFQATGGPFGVQLHLRAGIGIGRIWTARVGGVTGRWELLIAGDPVAQAVQALSNVAAGQVGISAAVGNHLSGFSRITSTGGALVLQSIDAQPAFRHDWEATPPCAEPLLRAFVPRSVQARLDAGQTDLLAEFRRVTAMFIGIRGFDYASADALTRVQCAFQAVQTAVYRYGGSINQLLVDDKGTVVVCGWGLALHAHDDDQVRAVRAALDLRRGLDEAGLRGSFGVTTGEVFTGLLGNRRRCTYTIIGDVVNVAARLMQAADGDILCDLSSFEAAGRRVEFETLPQVRVKGRKRAVEVFRPIQVTADGSSKIVGRVRERRVLREQLEQLIATGTGGVVILEGEAGIGKSRLVADVVERARSRGLPTIVAAGDAIERSAPYHVWCPLFDALLGLNELAGRGGAEFRVRELLEHRPLLVPFAPLLNPVLRLNLRETEQSRRIPPRGRAVMTRELLVHLFRCAAGDRPMLLVLEDAHWLDSASWGIAEYIERDVAHVLLVVALRPVSQNEKAPELIRLCARTSTVGLRLDALRPEETRALACQRLHARRLAEPVARLILDKAEGHPFFTEELVNALRDRGLLQVQQGICSLAGGADPRTVQIPNTVQVVVSSRIDQLSVPQQLTIKVASLVGRTFDIPALRAVYPIEIDPEELLDHLQALIDRDLVQRSPSDPGAYLFKHTITRDVAYGLLPYALRRQLHAAAAGWHERRHPDDLAPFYPVLAHHWSKAEDVDRALYYLEKAGEEALNRHASDEALRFFREAVEIDRAAPPAAASGAPVVLGPGRSIPARDARRIRWERRLGDASMNLGRWEEGRHHFERALSLSGYPLPASDRAWVVALAREVLTQAGHRLAPALVRQPSPQAADLLREAVCARDRVGSIAYLYERITPVLYSIFSGLNLAERLGPSLELGLAYSNVGNLLGLMRLHRIARFYHGMARATATRLGEPAITARVLGRASLYRIGVGDWDACGDLEAAMALWDEVGDSYLWEETAAIRARAAQRRGEFEVAAQLGRELYDRAIASGSSAHEIWGIDTEAWANVYLGHYQTALELTETGLRWLTQAVRVDRLAELDLLGAKALAHLYRSEWDDARQVASRIVDAIAASPPPLYFADLGISAAAETYLALWETQATGRAAPEAALVRRLCGQLRRYARSNPPARVRAFLWQGCAEWQSGRPERAQHLWRRCLVEAEHFRLPYETARLHCEWGRRIPAGDPARDEHLVLAESGFRALHAQGDASRVAAALTTDRAAAATC